MEIDFGNELKLAAIGVGFAILGLILLSLLQTTRKRREAADRLAALREETCNDADSPPGSVPFFLARFTGSSSRYFRVYIDEGALLFLHAGPFFVGIDEQTARGSDQRHWLLQAGKTVLVGLLVGGIIAVSTLVILGVRIMGHAVDNAEGAGSFMQLILGIVAFLAVMFVIIVPGVVWRIVKRGRELDAMSRRALREEAETNLLSFRATAENLSNIQIKKLDLDNREWCTKLSFRHEPTGRWTIETFTTPDTEAALTAFRALFGHEVEVDHDLARRFPADSGPAPKTTGV